MANFDMTSAAKRASVPIQMEDTYDAYGRRRVAYDSITFAADLTAADTVSGPRIPAGARVLEVKVRSEQLGTAGGNGELDCGWSASADGGEAADADGFIAAIEVGSAIANVTSSGQYASSASPAGLGKVFSEEVQLVFTANETTDDASTKILEIEVEYVID